MYAMHYNQMMQFYHPNYQANTATLSMMPPPPFGNPPQFVPGNNPQFVQGNQQPFMQGNQQPRPNTFIPPTNNYQQPANYQNQGNNNPNMRR